MTLLEKIIELLSGDATLMDNWFNQNLRVSLSYKQSLAENILRQMQDMQLSDNGVYVVPSRLNIEILDQVLRELPRTISDSGVINYERALLSTINNRVATANDLWQQLKLSNLVIPNLDELSVVLNHVAEVRSSVSRGTQAQEESLYRAIILNSRQFAQGVDRVSWNELKRIVTQKAGILPRYAGTIANTELYAMDREIRKLQGQKAGIVNAKYIGPFDAKTRPFCRAHLNVVAPWAFWEQIQNRVGPQPPSVYGGGYNCRHILMPFDPSWQEREYI